MFAGDVCRGGEKLALLYGGYSPGLRCAGPLSSPSAERGLENPVIKILFQK
jgi:hypothetical protein